MAVRKFSKAKYKRVVLKLSGETLGGQTSGVSIDPQAALSVAKRVKSVARMKVETTIVIGGGNIIRGAASGIDRAIADYMGMLATVINALALRDALESVGVKAQVQSAIKMDKVADPININGAREFIAQGGIVIFAGGTGNPFFTTDTAAALRASEIEADAVLKATKVDGVFSSDPLKNPKAKRYGNITYAEVLKKNLKIMDMAAFSLCMENNIPIIVFDFFRKDSIKRAVAGDSVGTLVS